MIDSDLQGRQASLDDAGLAVLDDLVQGLKVLVPQGEDHPARVVIFPPQPHRLLTTGLHLSHKGKQITNSGFSSSSSSSKIINKTDNCNHNYMLYSS